jgi:hypothetical protein
MQLDEAPIMKSRLPSVRCDASYQADIATQGIAEIQLVTRQCLRGEVIDGHEFDLEGKDGESDSILVPGASATVA